MLGGSLSAVASHPEFGDNQVNNGRTAPLYYVEFDYYSAQSAPVMAVRFRNSTTNGAWCWAWVDGQPVTASAENMTASASNSAAFYSLTFAAAGKHRIRFYLRGMGLGGIDMAATDFSHPSRSRCRGSRSSATRTLTPQRAPPRRRRTRRVDRTAARRRSLLGRPGRHRLGEQRRRHERQVRLQRLRPGRWTRLAQPRPRHRLRLVERRRLDTGDRRNERRLVLHATRLGASEDAGDRHRAELHRHAAVRAPRDPRHPQGRRRGGCERPRVHRPARPARRLRNDAGLDVRQHVRRERPRDERWRRLDLPHREHRRLDVLCDSTKWQPTTWICGTGKSGSTTGDGNADYLVSSDGVHPTQAGHDACALAWGQAISNLLRQKALKNLVATA